MAWIKVHAGNQRKKYWFNSNLVIHISEYPLPLNEHKATLTFLNAIKDDPWTLSIHETPEEVIALIDRATALVDMLEN